MAYKNVEDKKRYDEAYRKRNRQMLRDKAKIRRRVAKQKVLDHYGAVCKHCGFDNILALQIDHIHNDGAEERKALGNKNFSGWRFYEHLIQNNYPEGYQTLCANCNMIKELKDKF